MVRPVAALSVVLVTLAWAGPARGQDKGYFQEGGSDSLTFTVDRERNSRQRILIASLFGGSILFGGVGLLFHVDSKDKADEVSTGAGRHSGRIYTEELDDIRRAGIRSRNLAIASYAVGGGFLVGTFIAYLLTDPGQETIHVGTEADRGSLLNGSSWVLPRDTGRPSGAPAPRRGARLLVEPTDGGALVGGAWRF